jgi:hypothetical protein
MGSSGLGREIQAACMRAYLRASKYPALGGASAKVPIRLYLLRRLLGLALLEPQLVSEIVGAMAQPNWLQRFRGVGQLSAKLSQ